MLHIKLCLQHYLSLDFCFVFSLVSQFVLVVNEFNISEGNPEVSFPNKKASSISNLRENKFSSNFVIAKIIKFIF